MKRYSNSTASYLPEENRQKASIHSSFSPEKKILFLDPEDKETYNNFFFIPKNLNLRELLTESGYGHFTKHIDKFHFVIDQIIYKTIHNKKYYSKDKEPFVPLHSRYMEQMVTKHKWQAIKDLLIDMNVIECNGSYLTEKYAMGYKLHENYIKSEIKQIRANDKRISEKIINKEIEAELDFTKIEITLKSNLNKIQINYDAAIKHIENTEYETIKQYNSRLYSIRNLHNNRILFAKDTKTGRLFTNVSNCPRDIRQFLQFNNSPLAEVDIVNAQPFFLNAVIKDYILNNISSVNTTNSLLTLYKQGEDGERGEIESHMSPIKMVVHRVAGIERFRKETSNGVFYEVMELMYLSAQNGINDMKVGKEYNHNSYRDYIKHCTYVLFFAKHASGKFTKLFKQRYPGVLKMIEDEKKVRYQDLAIKLQKIEANFIVNIVSQRFSDHFPGEPLFTIHDSVMVSQERTGDVRYIMQEESLRLFGLSPAIKIKKY